MHCLEADLGDRIIFLYDQDENKRTAHLIYGKWLP